METINVNALKWSFYRKHFSSYKTFVDNYRVTSEELIHFLKEWGDSEYLIELSTEYEGENELYNEFLYKNPDDVDLAEKRHLRPSALFGKIKDEFDNLKGIKPGRFKNLYEYFKENYNCSEKCQKNLRNYSYMDALCRIQIRKNSDIDEIRVSVEEFFSIISNNNDYLNYISTALDFTGKDQKIFKFILNEDRIVRDIVSYFWNQLSDYTKDKYEYEKDKIQNLLGDKGTETVKIIEILNILVNSESKKWYNAANLMRIKNHLRNAAGHREKSYFKDDADRVCKENILFTLIYTVLALRSSLKEKGEIQEFKWPPRELQVYCNPSDSIDIELSKRSYNSREYVSVSCKSESGGYRTYPLNKGDEYYLKYRGVFKVPEDTIMGIAPIAIWNGTEFRFSPDSYSIQSDDLKGIDKTLIEELEKHYTELSEIKGNTKEATEILIKILTVLEGFKTTQEAEEKARQKQKQRIRVDVYQSIAYGLFAICIGWLAFNCFEAGHNILYLEYKGIYYVSFIVPVILSILLLGIHKCYKHFFAKNKKYCDIVVAVLSFVVIACAFLPNLDKNVERFISSYDIDLHDSLYNQNVVQFLESYVSHNNPDELARMKLTEFYLSIQDEKNALRISSPMKDYKRYKEGCCLSAEALYLAPDSINVLWELIDGYKSEYGEIRPAALQYIEGDLLIRGEGRSSDINTGMNILRKLADSGYPKAQYRFGYYNSKNRIGFQHYFGEDPEECHTPYDLFTAIEYLRKAASKLPEAALELGSMYADLAVKDSAEKYFNLIILRQIPKTSKLVQDKANYYKSIYYSLTNRMKEADSILFNIKDSYVPAKMYYASRNNDIISVINTYEYIYKKNKYEGVRYIDPLVYAYIAHGDDQKALERLISTRPEGNFNSDFIKGIKYFLKEKQYDGIDTLATIAEGLTYIKKAASQGCVFARMLIDYHSAKFHIIHDKVDVSPLITDLHRIGETIPFAFVLESKLLTMLDRGYPIIEEAIFRAMGRGQTSEAWLLASMPSRYIQLLIDKWVDGNPEIKDVEELLFKRSLMEGGFMYLKAPCKKQVCLYNAFLLDLKYDSVALGITMGDLKHKNRNLAKLHFWTDVALSNHAFFMYSFLFRASCLYNDEANKRKLFEAALNDYPFNVPTNDKTIYWEGLAGSHWTNIYTHAQMHLSKEYLQRIQQKYSKKPTHRRLFDKQYIEGEEIIKHLNNNIPMEEIWNIEDESFVMNDNLENLIKESFNPRQPFYLYNDNN